MPLPSDGETGGETIEERVMERKNSVVTRLEADVQTCERIVGEVIQVRAEGRVHSCTRVPMDQWDDEAQTSTCRTWSR